MSNISISLSAKVLRAFDRDIRAWCNVRNELNGNRKIGSVAVYTQEADGDEGEPYMPREFPTGRWDITGIIPHPDQENDNYLYPYFIATTARQNVQVWNIDKYGKYESPSGRFVADYGYGLHFSSSPTTLGCIRIANEADLRWLVSQIKAERKDRAYTTTLTVTL